ncbi:putative uracil-DNA glycosylase [Tupanvirus deep ocean]|uniref:Uracil-DNA glycosylase n=2 Tax=Tupanvirus TaxID=2094720 RepID=A0AC62A9I8_9VIRU|nr:putative uracil-DNA glycosylase [Tupanvirus deep ocean]QKU34283.1 putative uracil-DNA glycosylase [Tupanvirus deep ocean]
MEQISLDKRKPLNELDFGDEDENSESETENISTPRKIFMDEDEDSDDDDELPTTKKQSLKQHFAVTNIEPIIGDRAIIEYLLPDANNYSFKTWNQCFPDKKIVLRSLVFNPAWNDFFNMVERKPYFKKMQSILSDCLAKSNETMLPHAELVFNAFNVLSPKDIRVVIIGQDPYPGANKINGKLIPQATGFCFSAPLNYPTPDSLKNIYENMHMFGHIQNKPTSGCLSAWVLQGCFMINASLTTLYTKKNVHKNVWKNFTDDLLSYINKNYEKIVFLVWGKDAHLLCKYIDPYKHHIITSSHPSPLAYNKTFGGYSYGILKNERDRKDVTYPPFQTTDHFGRVNSYLKSIGKREIIWDLLD